MTFNLKKRTEEQVNTPGTKENLEKLAGEIADMNYSDFTAGEDYASLAKRYSQNGQKAMDDTIGKVAARTGGMASSYATAAGNQAYSGYMEKLEDAARALYDSQRQEKIDNLGISQSLYQQNYQQGRDKIEDKRYIDSIQRENSDIMQSRSQDTIAMMLAAGMTMANIQKQYPDLVGNSGYDAGYWEAYYKKLNAPTEDPGELTDKEKAIIEQYNWYIKNGETPPKDISDKRDEILGLYGNKISELEKNIMGATSYDEALEYAAELNEIDEKAAKKTLEAWEKAHHNPVPEDSAYYTGKASPAGYKFDKIIFS